MEWEENLMALASRNEGMVAKFHLPDLGLTSDHWWRARRTGRWVDVSSRVLGVKGAPDGEARRALAATLDAGPTAFLHERSALAWLGLKGYSLARIKVARRRGGDTAQQDAAHAVLEQQGLASHASLLERREPQRRVAIAIAHEHEPASIRRPHGTHIPTR